MASLNAQNRLTQPFIANSKIIFTLPLGGKIRRGCVILTGNVVLSAGTVNGVAQGEGAPTNLISRIIVTATPVGGSRYPGGKIVDAGPRSLLRYAAYQHDGRLILEQSGSTLGGGANGTYPIYFSVPIYWADDVLRNGIATALNTDDATVVQGGTYASVQVEVDTANVAACLTGNNATVDYSGLAVQWVDDRVAVPGDTVTRYQESHEVLIAAAQKRMQDPAMPQDGAFESISILAEQGAALTVADTLLNRVTISGPTLDFDKYSGDIRQCMYDDEWLNPAQTAAGMYFIDFTDGALTNTVQANGLQFQFDVNNPSGANLDSLDVFTRRVFPPMPAPKAATSAKSGS